MIEDPASTGLTAALFAAVLGLFEVVKRLMPARKNGGGRVLVECPNRIHTLNSTVERLEKGISHVEDQLRPIDGIEQWKRNQMQDVLLKQILDRSTESVTLQQKSLLVLEKIALRPPRREDKTDGKRKPKFVDESSPG